MRVNIYAEELPSSAVGLLLREMADTIEGRRLPDGNDVA